MGARFNEGARQSWLALARLGKTTAWLARQAEPDPEAKSKGGVIAQHLYGDRVPGGDYITKYHDILGVDGADWGRPPAEEFIPPALRDEHAEQAAHARSESQGVNGSAADSGAT